MTAGDKLTLRFGGDYLDLNPDQVCELLIQLKDGELRRRIIGRLDTQPDLFHGPWRKTVDSLAKAVAA